MNDRRRNIIVLTTVVALLIGSLVVIFTKPTKLGLDLQGGVQLVYEARPTKQQPTINQESLDRALDIMRDRVDSLGVAEPELQRSGAEPDRGQPPGRQERGARRRPGRHHGPDVLLRLGTEHPRRGLQDEPGGGQRRPAADLRALQRGQAGVEVPAGDRRQQHDQRALVRVRQEVARADQRRDPGRDRRPRSRRTCSRRTSPTRPRSSRCRRGSSSCAPSTTATRRPSAARSTSGGC